MITGPTPGWSDNELQLWQELQCRSDIHKRQFNSLYRVVAGIAMSAMILGIMIGYLARAFLI